MGKLTEKDKQDYFDHACELCPKCGARTIASTGSLSYSGGLECTQDMMCSSCDFKWRDIYKLDWISDIPK